MRRDEHDLAALAAKLERLGRLGDDDRAAIRRMPYRLEAVEAGRHLVREGSKPVECCVLVHGYACRYKVTEAGARQIVSFHIAGDILDLQHLHLATADHHVQAITWARVAWIPQADLRLLARERPAVAEAMWRDTLIDASIFREWVLNVGRRDAKTRIAHMLCEFVVRCEAAGLGPPATFELPMTQEQIADATGLTAVHVNRMLKALTADGALEGGYGHKYRVRDWGRFLRIAQFDQTYLHEAAA